MIGVGRARRPSRAEEMTGKSLSDAVMSRATDRLTVSIGSPASGEAVGDSLRGW